MHNIVLGRDVKSLRFEKTFHNVCWL